jgi:hypothetical protein
VADSHAVRRQAGEARRPGLLGGARLGEPGGSEEGDGRLLHRARQLPQDPWRHDERERAGRDLPGEGQALRHDAAGRARRSEHSHVRLQGARGQRQQAAAVVPPVPRAAEAHPRPRRAALLRPVRAAGEGRPAHLHRRAGADEHQGRTRAAGRRLRRGPGHRVQEPLGRLLPDPGQEVGRLHEPWRLRRAPVPADELQRPIRRHVRAGARAGTRDAQLLRRQVAAVLQP